eukprot:4659086-Amphidinium_carterae.1
MCQENKGYSAIDMLHQGVAYYYNDIEGLKYLMIAKTHAKSEDNPNAKLMDKLLDENEKNEIIFWDKATNILGLVEDNQEWLAAAAAADDEDKRADEVLRHLIRGTRRMERGTKGEGQSEARTTEEGRTENNGRVRKKTRRSNGRSCFHT